MTSTGDSLPLWMAFAFTTTATFAGARLLAANLSSVVRASGLGLLTGSLAGFFGTLALWGVALALVGPT